MVHHSKILKTFSILMLLVLAFGAPRSLPVRAAQASPESAPPAGLSTTDWDQIQALLSNGLPAQLAYMKASNTGEGDWFGHTIAVSGNTVVIGAPYESSNAKGVNGNQNNNLAFSSGAAYVFIRSGTKWSQQAYLKASNTQAQDCFGISVSIYKDTVVVGAIAEDSNARGVNGNQVNNLATDSGAAYVFTRSGSTWSQQAYLKASNTDAGDNFGYATVAISGDTVIIGAFQEDSSATGVNGDQGDNSASDSGAAYIFTRNGTTWSQQAYLKASNSESLDNFGRSVAISGNTVVIGAFQESSKATGVDGDQSDDSALGSGAAYVFIRSGTTWSQQAYLKASNTGPADYFGVSVAISGDTIVVGASQESSNATGVDGPQDNNLAFWSGAAYVFTRSGTTWSQQAYLKASNTGWGDLFGEMVAISGDKVVVGAREEDSNARGVNGNQNDNSASDSGAAYTFTRSGTTWSQQAYLKASNTESIDLFGFSVAISGNTVLVGAGQEASHATGVNGDQNDNSAGASGATYVYLPKYTTTLHSVGTYDGWILESGEDTGVGGTLNSTSTTFNLGDEAGDKQYRAILSFNTAALPYTAIITKATIRIKKQGQVGLNPFTVLGGLKLDIRKPFFGATAGLVINDFQAVAGKSAVGTFNATPVNNWYRAIIGSVGYPYINKTGTTQFRLYFTLDDNETRKADYMKFYSGNYAYPLSRPALVIEYYVP